MDYLDPRKKKIKKIQLMIGYGLLGIAISIATVVFVYLANGYYIDRETGVVIRNGLIYIDSKPESASVFLNGVQQSGSTDARLVVPEGDYSIELTRDGYHTWSRKLILEGGTLRRLTYARLIPSELQSEVVLRLPAQPSVVSQSIDKRWLISAYNGNSLLMHVIDLNRSTLQVDEIGLAVDLLAPTDPGDPGVWTILDWADDNRTFLAEYRRASGVEYVLIDRANPALSKNVTSNLTSVKYTSVTMRDRKNDLVFLHDNQSGMLYKANVSNGAVEPYLSDVVDFVAFGNDSVLYITLKDAEEGSAKAVLHSGGTNYELRKIKADDEYLLEMAKLGNALVLGVGSGNEGRVIVYNDPIHALQQNDFSTIPVPTTVLRVENPQELTISSDSSVILARGGQDGLKLASHEFEEDRTYVFTIDMLPHPEQTIRWVDGQHFMIGLSDESQLISDFDGSNQHQLTGSLPAAGSYYDRNIDLQYSVLPPEAEGASARLMRTFMRSAADR